MILKQSTQIKVRVGPFVDATDGVTPETTVALGTADQAELLKNNGAATVDISAATWAAVTGADGWYDLTLTTSHTDTVGTLEVVVQDSSLCLPVFMRFQVIEEAVYDAFYASAATGFLQPTVGGRTLDVTATGAAGIDWANVEGQATSVDLSATAINLCDTTTTNTDMRGTDSALLAASAPANFGDLAITATTGKTTVGTNDDKTGYSISGTKTTLDALNDIAATAVVSGGAINTTGGAVDTVTSVTNQVTADVTAISGDTVAADNLELQYDTTGLTGDNFPATQAQVGNIGSASGGAINIEAAADNTGGALKGVTFVGVQTANTYAVTDLDDEVRHNITHSGNAIDIVYQFEIGGNRQAVEILFNGYLSSSNDVINVQAYDFGGAGWDTVTTISGQGGTVDVTETIKLLSKHTGSGADLGDVYIRFVCSAQTAPDLFVDQLLIAAVSTSQSVGYDGGAVWIDTVHGTAGTEPFVNGVADNPSLTFADALTIAASVGIESYHVSNESTITLASGLTNTEMAGNGWVLALGGQDVSNSHFFGAQDVSGTATAATGEMHFESCEMSAVTLGQAHLKYCGIGGNITMTAAAAYTLSHCYSQVAGAATPVLDFGAAVGNTEMNLRHYSGGIEVQNMGQTGTDTMSFEGHGQLIINANCVGGSISLRGNFKVTDNSGGAVTVIQDDNAVNIASILADTNELQTDDIPTTLATLATAADLATVDANVDAVLEDTGTTLPATLGTLATASALATVDTNVDAILVDTDTTIPALIAALNDIAASDILTTQLTESYAADGAAPTLTQALMLIQQVLTEFSIAGTTTTVKKLDGTTTAAALTHDDATNATSATRSS